MKGCHTGTGRPCHESPPAGKSCRERGWRMHIKNVLLRGRGELFLAPKSFPSPPQTPPLPSKRALQKQASAEQPAIGRSRPHRSESLQDTRLRSGTKEEGTRERTAPAQRSGSSERQQQGQNHRPMHEEPTPAGCPQRDALPLSTSGSRMQGQLLEGERTEEGAGRQSLHLPESAVSIPQDGNRNGSNLPCERPSSFLPGLCPKNAKRPPFGGPCILFPHPAGAGHGHRNYSALSALAGASVLASGRRVSSMMAMGALSPLRGMASFITRV